MKKINLKIVLLAVILFNFQIAYTQVLGESFFTFNYSPSLPTSTLKDFIDKPSWISFRGDFMNDIKNQWSAGFGIGYTRFYDRLPRTVFEDGNNDISAVQTRQIELIPLVAKANYVNKSNSSVHFYAGIGIGIGFVSYDKLWGVYDDSNNKTSFRFCFEPGIGAYIQPGKNSRVRIHTGLAYMFIPYESSDINNISFLAINLGVRIPTR